MKIKIIDEKTGKEVFNGEYSYSELEKESRETNKDKQISRLK